MAALEYAVAEHIATITLNRPERMNTISREMLDELCVVLTRANEDADVRVSGIRTDGPVSFTLTYEGVDAPMRLAVPGAHNAINAAGAEGKSSVLRGQDAQGQLVVTGKFAGDALRDVTRQVKFETKPAGIVTIDESGLVKTAGDGTVTIAHRQ